MPGIAKQDHTRFGSRCQAAIAHLSQEWSRLGQKLSRDWAGLKDRALGTGWHNITVYDEGIQVKGQLFTGWDVVRDRLDNHGYGIANDQLREHLLHWARWMGATGDDV